MSQTPTKSGNGKATPSQERALQRQELKRELSKATSARKRLDLLISHPQSAALVPTLPAEELYFTIREVGLHDCVELVRITSPGQFRTFLDLDAWKREQLDPSSALLWLRAAHAGIEDEAFRKKLHLLDMEVLELLLKTSVKTWDLQEDEDPEPQGISWRSPEGRYLVEFLVEGEDYIGVKEMLDELYAEDPFRAVRLLEAVRWELPSELEETAFRWRNARLADLGFPSLAEALSYYAYFDPDAALPRLAGPPAVPEGFFLSRVASGERFLDSAAARLEEAERDVLERQLVTVFNAALVVEGVDPGDLAAVQRALASARDTLSLGLEHASKAEPVEAAALLAGAPLKRIFQVGASLALKLKFRADRLMRAGKSALPGTKETPLFDAPIGEAIVALRRKRPLCVDDSKVPPGQSVGPARPFRDRADLHRVAELLTKAEQLAELMATLGFKPEASAAGVEQEQRSLVRFSDFYLTAAAQVALGGTLQFAPIRLEQLPELAKRAFTGSSGSVCLDESFERVLFEPLRAAAAHLEGSQGTVDWFVDLCRARLIEEWGRPLASGNGPEAGLSVPLIVA